MIWYGWKWSHGSINSVKHLMVNPNIFKSIYSHQYGHINSVKQTVVKNETQKGVKLADLSPKWFGWCQGNNKHHRARRGWDPGNALTLLLWSTRLCDILRLCQSVHIWEGELRSYRVYHTWGLGSRLHWKSKDITDSQQSIYIS